MDGVAWTTQEFQVVYRAAQLRDVPIELVTDATQLPSATALLVIDFDQLVAVAAAADTRDNTAPNKQQGLPACSAVMLG